MGIYRDRDTAFLEIDDNLQEILTRLEDEFGQQFGITSAGRSDSKSSQHYMDAKHRSRAVDIVVPVDLQPAVAKRATELGATGIGMDTARMMLHIDVRSKTLSGRDYDFWAYVAGTEQTRSPTKAEITAVQTGSWDPQIEAKKEVVSGAMSQQTKLDLVEPNMSKVDNRELGNLRVSSFEILKASVSQDDLFNRDRVTLAGMQDLVVQMNMAAARSAREDYHYRARLRKESSGL